MADFVHLHVHSHYSLLDSSVKIGDLVKRTRELGMGAVAVTDHGFLFGAIELQKKAHDAGIQPIFGVQINVLPENADPARARAHHLVLLAEDDRGYRNLVQLTSRAALRGTDRAGRPITRWDDLVELRDGLVALSGDLGGEVAQALLRKDRARAEAAARRFADLFGPDRFFLELQRHEGIPEQDEAVAGLVDIGRALELPLVATNNVHYLKAGDHEAHAILMCIGMDRRVDRRMLQRLPLRDLFLRSPDEMLELFADLPDAIRNTVAIAERCRVRIPTGTYFLPQFPVPDGETETSWLRELARKGLAARFDELRRAGRAFLPEDYTARLDLEIEVIVKMGFAGYFLIVSDFIQWAKDQGIPVGPGRGSGAGSIAAWALRITDLDPIPYGLLFERFLNPERVSMPDFDVDFCQDRRGEVIDYVKRKYGRHNVGQIVTFGQLKAKAVVKDVARVLNLSFADSDRISKLIPDELNIKLADAYAREAKLRELVAEDPTIEYLYQVGLSLEGNNRNTGVHAAGVVISPGDLWEYVPVFTGVDGEIVTQYAKDEVEAAGLVKFDFLGLKTLTVIDDAIRLVNRGRPDDQKLDFARIDLNHPAAYELIKTGDTTGIFQMESDGFQRLMKQLKPDCFEDIVAAVALYRPGPLGSGMVEQFIDCKHGRRQIEYPHPSLENLLRDTYGVMVYQEQVMQTAQVLAGYTLGGADLLRRAMGKKKKEEMDKQRDLFCRGATERGTSEADASHVFDLMAKFAEYGFNKSHSAAYAVITFQTAYLKSLHPQEFYAALMSNDADRTDKVVRYILDARARGIRVLPPDVNASDHTFTVAEGRIRFGLGAIKGIGAAPIEAIVEARQKAPFSSFWDFCERVDAKRCGKRVIETLIRSGALDALAGDRETDGDLARIGKRRARMFAALDAAVERGARAQTDLLTGQSSLFGLFAEPEKVATTERLPDADGWTPREVLQGEKQTLGFYVSGHPLDSYRDEVDRFADVTTESIRLRPARDDVRLAGIISSFRERPLRSGDGKMAILQLEDHFGEIEAIVFQKVYPEVAPLLESDEPVLVRGHIRLDEEGETRVAKLVVSEMQLLSAARTARVRRVTLAIHASELDATLLRRIDELFRRHPGTCDLVVRVDFGWADAVLDLPPDLKVHPGDALLNETASLFGDNRRLRFA